MEELLTELAAIYAERPFLAGDQFSRADLTAAALFAPMFQPAQYPVPWPKTARIPKDIKHWLDQWQPQIRALEKVYEDNRRPG
jgi:glutathione S-transferase